MIERTPETIVAELENRSRRARFFLVVGLSVIILSLIGSAVFLDVLRRQAEASRDEAREELAKYRRSAFIIETAQRAPPEERARILARGVSSIEEAAQTEPPPQQPLGALRLDLFVCAGGDDSNRDLAQQLRVALQGQTAERPVVRTLSRSTNENPIYRVTGIQVRYNPEEEEAADRLVGMLREREVTEVRKILTYFPTPGQLSLFFCEGVNLAATGPSPGVPGE